MARIPLYNGGEIPANITGVRVPIVGQGVTAGPAMGNALVAVGGLGVRLAVHQSQANDTVHLMDAEGVMQQHQAEQRLFQEKNKDQETWLPAWQKRVESAQGYISKLPVTGPTRQTLDKSVSRWGELQGTEIQGAAFKNSVRNAKQAVYNRATEAAQAGDVPGIDKAIDLLPLPFASPEERDQMRLQLHGTALDVKRSQVKNNVAAALDNNQPETAKSWLDQGLKSGALTADQHAAQMADVNHAHEVQNLVTIANDDPRRALELATAGEQAKRISGLERVRIVDTAQAKLNELRTTSLKDYTGQIQMGVADKEKFAGKILDDPNLEPVDKANLANFLDQGPVNDPITYAKLYAEAKSFEGKEGSPEYSRLLSRVDMTLKEDQKSSVIATLSDSVKGPKDGTSRAKSAIYARMADDLKAGLFGDLSGRLADPKTMLVAKDRAEVDAIRAELSKEKGALWWKENKTPNDLEMEARKKWWERTNPNKGADLFTSYVVDDSAATRAASDRMWKAAASYEKWNSENPKATPEEASAYAETLLVRQRAAAQIGGAPTMNSMPSMNGLQGSPPPVSILPPIDDVLKKYAPNLGK